MKSIRIAVAGVGNCAASLIEGICYYRQHPDCNSGLLFPELSGYRVPQIEVVAAFDVSERKAGKTLNEAIYQAPNNFVQLPEVEVDFTAPVYRGPTLDGNPDHLKRFVTESALPAVDAADMLKKHGAEILVNLLPTGSHQATEYYARAALDAGCAFINCIPTLLAQRQDFQALFAQHGLPLFGDDVKSQVGTTILHRSLLHMLESRGASLQSSSQINIGGNTDFANFVHRAKSKLVSKRKSLKRYVHDIDSHVGHHYDPTKGPYKHALIDVEAAVFGGSRVHISVKLESDDKPNSAGTVVDLVRLARAALDRQRSGVVPEACAYYFKSPPVPMDDPDALAAIRSEWLAPAPALVPSF